MYFFAFESVKPEVARRRFGLGPDGGVMVGEGRFIVTVASVERTPEMHIKLMLDSPVPGADEA
jgi:hypothetical protein